MKRYLYEITLGGVNTFPTDMLRYDACWPATEEDSHKIHQTPYSEPKGAQSVKVRTRQLKGWQPTFGRWRSFGWSVVSYEIVP